MTHLWRGVIACAAMLVIYFAVPLHPETSVAPLIIRIGVSLAALAAVVLVVQRQLLRQLSERDASLSGLVIAMFAGVVLFALLDYMIALHGDNEFIGLNTRIDALYYALTTLFTIGFGDVSAQGQLARGVLCVQMLFNVIVIATTGSTIVRQVTERARRKHQAEPAEPAGSAEAAESAE